MVAGVCIKEKEWKRRNANWITFRSVIASFRQLCFSFLDDRKHAFVEHAGNSCNSDAPVEIAVGDLPVEIPTGVEIAVDDLSHEGATGCSRDATG